MSALDFLCDVRNRQRAALYAVNAEATSEPATEPISIEQAREHCRVDVFEEGSPPVEVSDDDAWLTDVGIPAAREYCELALGRALAERSMLVTVNAFPSDTIPLPFGPVQSITSVKYDDQAAADAAYDVAYQAAYDIEFGNSADEVAADAAGVAAGDIASAAALEQTMPSTDYQIDRTTTPNRLMLAYGASWPSARDFHASVRVAYVSGYTNPEASPQAIPLPKTAKAAILLMLTHLYEHRGDETVSAPPLVDVLLARIPDREELGFA